MRRLNLARALPPLIFLFVIGVFSLQFAVAFLVAFALFFLLCLALVFDFVEGEKARRKYQTRHRGRQQEQRGPRTKLAVRFSEVKRVLETTRY